MPLAIGETKEVWGSGSKPYILKNCDGTVWSCTCPSWRNKGGGVMRTCKHLLAENGKAFEDARLAGVVQGKIMQTAAPAPKKPVFKTRILIRFRNDDGTFETLGSPLFESPRDLWDDEKLDELVADGEETGFYISCDAEGTKDPKTGVHTIMWLMFGPNEAGWMQDLHQAWKRRMGFELPSVDKWAWTDLEKELAGCACEQGSSCDISHNPASCPCVQCGTAEAESPEDIVAQVMGVKPAMRSPEPQENPVPLKGDGIERDKTKRINSYGGFVPFTDREKAVIVAEEEARKGRKLRQDEKADLFGPPVLLANNLEADFDPTGWLESEKLDGVRAYWNGEVFVSRQGNIYNAPAHFVAGLPKEPLDGELWMGRKQFQKTISVVKRQTPGPEWSQIKFVVFDAPIWADIYEDDATFERRLAHLETLALGSFAQVHPHRVCASRKEMEQHLRDIEALGGEGLMYRKPGSKYEARRSSTLLKAKPFKDAEAVVIGYEPGKKANKGKTGGLIVQMPNGKTFNVGTGLTAKDRENPPAIGATITYRYADTTDDGLPKCASYVTTRDYE